MPEGYKSVYASATNKLYIHQYSSISELCDMIDNVEKYHNKRPSALVMRPENFTRLVDLTSCDLALRANPPTFGGSMGQFMGIDVDVEMI